MILFIILIVLVSAIGTIWAAHACLWGLFLNPEIKPLEVLNLAATIAIAVLIQYYFTNKTTDLRSEKDLLIGNVQDIIATLRLCRDSLSTLHGRPKIKPSDTSQILQLFRRLSNSITHLEDSIRSSQCSRLQSRIPEIWRACDHYKYSATCAPFPVSPAPPNDQDRAFRDLSAKLQSLVFEINRHH